LPWLKIIDNKSFSIMLWYDNEFGYSCRVIDLIQYIVKKGLK
jgi:glyceraldehyde 3-phosphate dehydrogenase